MRGPFLSVTTCNVSFCLFFHVRSSSHGFVRESSQSHSVVVDLTTSDCNLEPLPLIASSGPTYQATRRPAIMAQEPGRWGPFWWSLQTAMSNRLITNGHVESLRPRMLRLGLGLPHIHQALHAILDYIVLCLKQVISGWQSQVLALLKNGSHTHFPFLRQFMGLGR